MLFQKDSSLYHIDINLIKELAQGMIYLKSQGMGKFQISCFINIVNSMFIIFFRYIIF